MKLSELPVFKKAVILEIHQDIPLKLMEMGCIEGAEIVALGAAPLGSPYYFRLNHTHIALGKEIIERIEISIADE